MSFLSEYQVVRRLLKARFPVIFYAERAHYHQYFAQLLNDLLQQCPGQILYITSDKNDPLLATAPSGLEVVYIHWWLGFLFPRIKGDVFIMTMTDLGNYIFKRSPEVESYVYVFHAMVSTHQQYTTKAFFHYDAIFCAGPAHVAEIHMAEVKYNLKKKDTVHYGYPLIDALKDKEVSHDLNSDKSLPVILIAPSWYKEGILETCIGELIKQLASLPYHIVIRPHPEYVKRRGKKMADLQRQLANLSNVVIDYSAEVFPALSRAGILITDRSGIAFEYALGMHRPVLFIDTPLKATNPLWEELGIQPIENILRAKIGIVMQPEQLDSIGAKINQLQQLKDTFPEQMNLLKKELLFNSDAAYKSGVDYILSRIKQS